MSEHSLRGAQRISIVSATDSVSPSGESHVTSFSERAQTETLSAADDGPPSVRPPSAFYIPSQDGSLIDMGGERVDKREALRRLEEHLTEIENGIGERSLNLEELMAKLRDDGSTRVLPEVRDERSGLYRAVTQPGLEVQHATGEVGLDVASAVSSAADAVASAAEAVGAAFVHAGEGIGEVVSRPVEYLKAHVPAVRHTSEGIASGIASGSQHMADFMERTGENLRPVTDAVGAFSEGTARFFGIKETSSTVYQPVPPTIPHVTRVAGPAMVGSNFDTASFVDKSQKPVKYVGHAAPVLGLTENSVGPQEKLADKWEQKHGSEAGGGAWGHDEDQQGEWGEEEGEVEVDERERF